MLFALKCYSVSSPFAACSLSMKPGQAAERDRGTRGERLGGREEERKGSRVKERKGGLMTEDDWSNKG